VAFHSFRFGEVLRVKEHPEGLTVEFSLRRDAERAKTQGTSYEGRLLNISFYSPGDASVSTNTVAEDANVENVDQNELVADGHNE